MLHEPQRQGCQQLRALKTPQHATENSVKVGKKENVLFPGHSFGKVCIQLLGQRLCRILTLHFSLVFRLVFRPTVPQPSQNPDELIVLQLTISPRSPVGCPCAETPRSTLNFFHCELKLSRIVLVLLQGESSH